MQPLGLEIGDHAALTVFFIVTAIDGISGSVFRVVQVLLLFQTQDDHLDQDGTGFISGNTVAQQALEFGYAAHPPPQRANCVVLERRFVSDGASLNSHRIPVSISMSSPEIF